MVSACVVATRGGVTVGAIEAKLSEGGRPANPALCGALVKVLQTYSHGVEDGVFTDGSCEPNPGPGTCAFVLSTSVRTNVGTYVGTLQHSTRETRDSSRTYIRPRDLRWMGRCVCVERGD